MLHTATVGIKMLRAATVDIMMLRAADTGDKAQHDSSHLVPVLLVLLISRFFVADVDIKMLLAIRSAVDIMMLLRCFVCHGVY